ncbi:MAG TPA: TetR/AcrR family transcriptional regulator [Allosphingosinicella sp.]|jgi:AcrR family transcriptional regulator
MANPNRYHRDDLESELLACAGRIIGESGIDALSLRELGRSANVSRAAPYHYFPTKAALLQRVGALGFARLARSIEAEMRGQSDPFERALAGFRGYLSFALSEPAIFGLMFADRLARDKVEPASAPLAFPFSSEEAARAFGLLVDGLSELPAFAVDERERLVRVNMVWAFVHGVSVLAIGRNLKGVAAETLLESGLRTLLREEHRPA